MFIGSYYYVFEQGLVALNMTSAYYLLFLVAGFFLFRFFKGIFRRLVLLGLSCLFLYSFSLDALLYVLALALIGYVLAQLSKELKLAYLPLLTVLPFIIILIYFKYDKSAPLMPLGLSFYSFKLIAYLADIGKGRYEPEEDLLIFLDYVLFFPCITSGPIHRFERFKEELLAERPFVYSTFSQGMIKVLYGIFEKVVFADYLALMVEKGLAATGLTVLLSIGLYAWQLYLDFDAVSNIAIGSAQLLGFDVGRNFHSPYLATSLKDFWRRWHISLSSWLRDYVYIPLGGNRKGQLRTYLNIVITFVISGLWHGSGFNFLLWGLLHGVLQIAEAYLSRYISFKGIGARVLNFVLVSFLWLIFRCGSFAEFNGILARLFTPGGIDFAISHNENIWLIVVLLAVIIIDILRNCGDLSVFLSRFCLLKWLLIVIMIFIFLVFGVYGGSYEPSDFIYRFF